VGWGWAAKKSGQHAAARCQLPLVRQLQGCQWPITKYMQQRSTAANVHAGLHASHLGGMDGWPQVAMEGWMPTSECTGTQSYVPTPSSDSQIVGSSDPCQLLWWHHPPRQWHHVAVIHGSEAHQFQDHVLRDGTHVMKGPCGGPGQELLRGAERVVACLGYVWETLDNSG
jgi:hypothetical protein